MFLASRSRLLRAGNPTELGQPPQHRDDQDESQDRAPVLPFAQVHGIVLLNLDDTPGGAA